ncbi:Acetyltransferase (GNAT) family protein [Brevibacterium siliguriense]|uniref:Acetyltransferase (GNAT) family protein n=1 Tax=Brevibacterium siliguriense TaxID=1136497 RepID=A0A1H1PQ68_9MICO|nr:GNAT family N-acetyltransferase [Brevibacterium siliguriense]SDS13254.1 Acetyltransferase (GNAT) family protein [Brevibacterium siliguriense]
MTTEAAPGAGHSGRGFDGFSPESLDLACRKFVIRRATEADVPALVALLGDDVLGATRESGTEEADVYARAFSLIDADPNQLLVAVTEIADQAEFAERTEPMGQAEPPGQTEPAVETETADQNHDGSTVVGTLQLSLLPSLSRRGALRLQIEAVRIGASAQGIGLGTAVFEWAHECGRRFGARLAQLTTDKSRTDAQRFYDRLGYVASHEGMKLPLD